MAATSSEDRRLSLMVPSVFHLPIPKPQFLSSFLPPLPLPIQKAIPMESNFSFYSR